MGQEINPKFAHQAVSLAKGPSATKPDHSASPSNNITALPLLKQLSTQLGPEGKDLLRYAGTDHSLTDYKQYLGNLFSAEAGLGQRLSGLGLSQKDITLLESLASEHVPKYLSASNSRDVTKIAEEDVRLFNKFWSTKFESTDETALTEALTLLITNKLQGDDSKGNFFSSIKRTGNIYLAYTKNLLSRNKKTTEPKHILEARNIASNAFGGIADSVITPGLDVSSDKKAMVSGQSKAFVALHKLITSNKLDNSQQIDVFKAFNKELHIVAPLRTMLGQVKSSFKGFQQILSANVNNQVQAAA